MLVRLGKSKVITLQVMWVVNDTRVNAQCSGLLGNLKTACQAKTVSGSNRLGEVCLKQMQLPFFCWKVCLQQI